MKIGIIGNGVVGGATGRALAARGHEVRWTDRLRSLETHTLPDVLDTDLVLLCLPTPQKAGDLACDTSAIDHFFRHGLPNRFRDKPFILRSTVPIGYTQSLAYQGYDLLHWPEFLTARTADEDANSFNRLLIGRPGGWQSQQQLMDHPWYRMVAESLRTVGPRKIRWVSSDESEFVKLAQNAFSAVKIAAFNELRCLADKLGLDWDECREGLLDGRWINPMHTLVPGPDGQRGFGGSCLPKDLANLIDCAAKVDADRATFSAALLWRNNQ